MDLRELRRSADERERGRDWSGFVEACRAVADHPEAGADAISYLQKAAVASEQHLRDLDGALAIWRRVAEIDPKNRYASAALRRLHLARGDWAAALAVAREHGAIRDCVRLFERALEGREGKDRLELLIHLGRLHEEVGERSSAPRALRAYQQAIEIAPGHPEAAAGLARLYDPVRDAAPLAAVLWTLVEQAGTDGEAIELLRRIASLAAGPLRDPEQELAAHRAIVERGGADLRALTGLVRHHQEREDWGEIDRLRPQIADALGVEPRGPDERAAYVEVAGRVLEIGERIGPVGGREVWCARALEIDPDCERLAPAAELLSNAAEEPAARARLAARAAALWRKRGDHGRAFESLRRAVALAEDREDALEALEEMAAIEDRWDEVAEVLREIAGQPLSLEEQVSVRLRLGRIYADHLRDVERAIKTYRRVSDLSPHGHGLRELARLYRKQGRTEEEVAALRRLRELAELPERREIDVRLAELERGKVDDAVEELVLTADDAGEQAALVPDAVEESVLVADNAVERAALSPGDAVDEAALPADDALEGTSLEAANALGDEAAEPAPPAPTEMPVDHVALELQDALEGAALAVDDALGGGPVDDESALERAVTQPEAVEPDALERAVTQPKAAEPEALEPEAVEPAAPEPAPPLSAELPVDHVALELQDALEGAVLAVDNALGGGPAEEPPRAEDRSFDETMSQVMGAEEADRALLKKFEALAEKTGRWDDFLVCCEHLARKVEARDPAAAVDLWLVIAVAHEVRRDDTASALLAVERASELAPDRLDLLVRRMELHRRRNEWAECDQLMARLSETG